MPITQKYMDKVYKTTDDKLIRDGAKFAIATLVDLATNATDAVRLQAARELLQLSRLEDNYKK